MGIRERLYDVLVRKNENVCREYEDYVRKNLEEHEKHRMRHWKTLGQLNWHYRIRGNEEPLLKRENLITEQSPETGKQVQGKEKRPYLNGAESRAGKWISPADLLRNLMQYDVISFDIFDTLLFRPFEKPQDLFYLAGEKLNALRFYNIRREAEVEARNRKERLEGHREITLEDIYACIEEKTGIPREKGRKTELELERVFCRPNPYMTYLLSTLAANGKRILLLSDMYLQEEEIKILLEKCGIRGYEKIFMSCDHRTSKREGGLYQKALDYLGKDFGSMIHIGDNPVSDVEKPQEYGIEVHYYQNVNLAGKPYRTEEIQGLIGSAYRGIVNQKLHCGYVRYNAYYEFGFLYGGFFALGYAGFIHQMAVSRQMDAILFVARDGYILKKVYDSLYKDLPTDYLLCSRISNLKMTAYRDKEGFLKEFVFRFLKEKKQITLEQLLENMEADFLKEKCKMELRQLLTEENLPMFLEFLDSVWEELKSRYEENIRLAEKYYKKFFRGKKRVLVVDIGWRGQGILALRNLEEDYWHFGCEITGVLAGCAPTQENLGQLTTGVLTAYLFSPVKNPECFRFHSRNSIHNILMELLTGAPSPSFKGFQKGQEGGFELEFDVPEIQNYEWIRQIHAGILDFTESYTDAFGGIPGMMEISGRDAYMPVRHILKNYSFFKRFFKNYEFQDMVGGTGGVRSKTMGDIFRKFGI